MRRPSVDEFLEGPAACAFVVLVDEDGSALADALAPPSGCLAAIGAMSEIEVWNSTHVETVDTLRTLADERRDLAARIVEHPAASWLWEPFDAARQRWVGILPDSAPTVDTPTDEPTRWDAYCQRPTSRLVTSTVHTDVSLYELAVGARLWDLVGTGPIRRGDVDIVDGLRVYEVDGAAAWNALCVEHPAVNTDDPYAINYEGGFLVPDWASVARLWDGVHLSMGALLTATLVRYGNPWSFLHSWEAEVTCWLREPFGDVRPLAPTEPGDVHAPHLFLGIGGTPLTRRRPPSAWRPRWLRRFRARPR